MPTCSENRNAAEGRGRGENETACKDRGALTREGSRRNRRHMGGTVAS